MMNILAERSEPANSLMAQVRAELDRTGLRLAFPPELEARYRLDLAPDRARELRHFVRIAAALYLGVGLMLKLTGITSDNWLYCLVQVGGTAAVALVIAQCIIRPDASYALRENSALACALLASLAAILVSYLTPTTKHDLIIDALPANFALMFMRLRFPAAVVLALVSFACFSAGILLRPGAEHLPRGFLITFMALLSFPALFGVHSLERASRRLYLHGLLQHLRVTSLAAENETLTQLSLTDPLTKIANRRRLDIELNAFCENNTQPGALLLIDVDNFKAFNDLHDHQAGDLCLQQVAERLSANLRQCDLLARFGGEEFVVLLPSVAHHEAASTAERLRAAIHACPFDIDGRRVHVTVSVGIAVLDTCTAPELLLEAADLALYAAKSAGRNQVRAYGRVETKTPG